MLDMEIISNQQFLDMLNNKSLYKENISNSLEKISEIESLIFRKANHWYRFEDCDLPNSTIIREWPSISCEDWIPKQDFDLTFTKGTSKVIFDLKKLPKKFLKYKIRHLTLSSQGGLLLLVAEIEGKYDLLILSKTTMNQLSIVKNIAIESSFFCGEEGIIFCREDTYNRPYKLYYKCFSDNQEKILWVEKNLAYRLRIIPSANCEYTCFVKSSDFHSGRLFLYMLSKEKLSCFRIINGTSIPRFFDIIKLKNEFYFIAINKKRKDKPLVYFKNIKRDKFFKIELCTKRNIIGMHIVRDNILLNVSTQFNYSFIFVKLNKNISNPPKEVEINFKRKVSVYSNCGSEKYILFLENDGFYESVFRYEIS